MRGITIGALCAALMIAATSTASAQTCSGEGAAANAAAQRLLTERGLAGALVMQDVETSAVVASASYGAGAPDLPLSTVKLFSFVSYWEHRSQVPASVTLDAHQLIAQGQDNPGRQLALSLRHALGSRVLLDDLAHFGFPACGMLRRVNCTALSAGTPDAKWANAMSIGETDFRVSILGLSRFLVAVGRDGDPANAPRVMQVETARRLRAAMLDAVATGTASGVRTRMGDVGRVGGKTGSGPFGERPFDGVFAGLVFDASGRARYSVVTYLRHAGRGGGPPAEISADMGRFLLSSCS